MAKRNYYAPYYNEQFFRKLLSDGFTSQILDNWCRLPTLEATGAIPVIDFAPEPNLVLPRTKLLALDYGIIDSHNHLDSYDPRCVLDIMDDSGIEKIMNLSGIRDFQKFSEEFARLKKVMGDRLLTAVTLPWSQISRPGIVGQWLQWLERCRERGVCSLKVFKTFGLTEADEQGDGQPLRIDDERFGPIWELCAEFDWPVFIHQADPAAFFKPIDERNERLEELGAHPDWHFGDPSLPERTTLLQRLEALFQRHADTVFVSVHVGNNVEDLTYVGRLLNANPNVYVDISARAAELGRQPHFAKKFMETYDRRILFGSDLPPNTSMYQGYRRLLETDDDCFMYPTHASGQGLWHVSGLHLGAGSLRQIYRDNAEALFGTEHKTLVSKNRETVYQGPFAQYLCGNNAP